MFKRLFEPLSSVLSIGHQRLEYLPCSASLDLLLLCTATDPDSVLRTSDNMFGKSRYFGLRGTRLNVAVGVLAGLDFL